jgi:hypothetical protein
MRTWFVLVVVAACSSAPPKTRPNPAPDDPCSQYDEKACAAQPSCHAEFGWPLECNGDHCTPSKAFGFVVCRSGATANCTKPDAACDEPDPACEAQGNYRVQWIGGCHENCVAADRCDPR